MISSLLSLSLKGHDDSDSLWHESTRSGRITVYYWEANQLADPCLKGNGKAKVYHNDHLIYSEGEMQL